MTRGIRTVELRGETLGRGRPQGLVAGVVNAARLLLAAVVWDENGEDPADEGGGRGRHEESGDRPVVHAQTGGKLQRL